MQKDSKILDDLARLASGAAGNLLEMKRELEQMVGVQVEKLLQRMNLVTREEFEVVRDMAAKARAEQEELRQKLDALLEKRD